MASGDKTLAAETVGVRRQTLHKWLKQEPFQAALAQAEGEAMRAFQAGLIRLVDKVLAAFEGALDDPLASHTVKLRAANFAATHLLRVRELVDLERRIEALEDRAEAS